MLTGDAGVGQSDVLDSSTRSLTEEALIAVSIGSASLVDTDTPDGFALAVEGAAEGVVVVANGSEVVLFAGSIVPGGGMVVGDVVAQLEELALKDSEFAIVHQCGQQVEALGVADGVGLLGGGAVAALVNVPDIDGGGVDGDILGRHGKGVGVVGAADSASGGDVADGKACRKTAGVA